MQRLKEHVPVSLCANEGLGSEQDVLRMLDERGCRCLVLQQRLGRNP